MALKQNVEQQNQADFQKMLRSARFWREQGLPGAVRGLLAEKGIAPEKCVIIWGDDNGYMMQVEHGFRGLIVDEAGRFFQLEMATDRSMEHVVELFEFVEVTQRQDFSLHNRGTGKGAGALAREVLAIMNFGE